MQMFTLRREQGRLSEVAPLVEMFVKEHSATTWKPGLALMYAELGLTDKARDVFEQFAANEFMDIPQDGVWSASITFLAEVCTLLGDQCRAEVLYRLLSPYAGHTVLASEWACFGAGSRFLGQLSATMARWEQAEAHFGVQQAAGRRAREHQRAGDQHPDKRRNLNEEIHALVKQRKRQLLRSPLAEKRPLEERLGEHAAEPEADEDEVSEEEKVLHEIGAAAQDACFSKGSVGVPW